MTMQDFIDEHYEEIDEVIKSHVPHCKIDDEEREMWILNDEGLYNWAVSEDVEDI